MRAAAVLRKQRGFLWVFSSLFGAAPFFLTHGAAASSFSPPPRPLAGFVGKLFCLSGAVSDLKNPSPAFELGNAPIF